MSSSSETRAIHFTFLPKTVVVSDDVSVVDVMLVEKVEDPVVMEDETK